MKKSVLSFLLSFAVLFEILPQEVKWAGPACDFSHGKLMVSSNNRFLVFEDGTPFFYLADTGWELFHRLNIADAEKYLENRRSKGFTVIQAVALAEFEGLTKANSNGDLPLKNHDPLQPDETYFQYVDRIIRMAAAKGLFIGLLPTWGDKVDKQWGIGPEVFNTENAYKYGRWIGNRYKDFPNIIWINGGDRSGGGDNKPVWEALAEGIKSVDKNHLMTFHPFGEHSSSEWFHNSSWLDFNMSQTGHGQRSYAIYKRLLVKDYNLSPVKPCFDGEPRYEDHPVGWVPDVLGWFNDADVRQALYWNLFSGGFGHTYGCHPIWQFLTPARDPVGLARHNWYDVIDLPGAADLIHARRLIESRPFLSRVPDQSMVANDYFPETDYVAATRGDGYAFIYFPTGWTATISPDKLNAKTIRTTWFDPRTGETKPSETIPGKGARLFTPPSGGRGNDWILVMDDESKNFGVPGR